MIPEHEPTRTEQTTTSLAEAAVTYARNGWPADNLWRVQRLRISDEEKELILGGNVRRLVRE